MKVYAYEEREEIQEISVKEDAGGEYADSEEGTGIDSLAYGVFTVVKDLLRDSRIG